jgi:large subunit ribosomal protein L25
VRLEGTAKAVLSEGGLVDPAVDSIEVRCTPRNVPNEIVIDVTEMTVVDVIRLGSITFPDGVVPTGDPEMPVVTVLTLRQDTTAAAPAEGEAAEAPEGAAAAEDTAGSEPQG